MIESFDDIKFDESIDSVEKLFASLKDQCNIDIEECKKALSASLKVRAEELLDDIINIAPYGNYERLLEKSEEILPFLQEDASAIENWKLEFIYPVKDNNKLLELVFVNAALDDGDLLKGYAFVGITGAVRHSFCQIHS